MMILLLISFFISLITCGLLIRYQARHLSFSGDHDLLSPQKFHRAAVPRIGGVGIATGCLFALLVDLFINPTIAKLLALAGLTALPLFGIGIAEDLTKRISVRIRLIFALLSALLFLYFFDISSIRLDIPTIDTLMGYPVVAIFFLAFAITGLANAYNIIDGFNGLASMVAVIAAAAILYIAFKVQDPLVISFSFIIIGSAIGFFIWNYPRGLLFLGDGGAYLIGFLIALASVLLVVRNSSVSPWFALMVNAYPIFETIFTIWRRSIYQGRSPGLPDGAHFHSLIYRRIMRRVQHHNQSHPYCNNAKTSPYLWILSSIGVVPAIVWWNATGMLMLVSILFVAVYVYVYFRIVTFKTPAMLNSRPPPK
jgi:UDP-N-acetylmuramyl pentapeptide phosphotransferase/UDP-N-acetylglucosamine-1-phosphate transferase